ncbi:NADPH:quinone oxidoreductase family protein [Novosphingobium sp. HII-3]|uniref:NADPH:quinone oxidoreductase family protein n=1 Tax=Novosphingobium sp. HII-3 TaxID=2075565 RepID=UPI000CDAAFDD|nr:NADPH:quinone oxidoreductase family protein [Novosphingobium sp. HII-3]
MMMDALVCEDFSERPTLVKHRVDAPHVKAGEVRLKVACAGLGFVDALICAGQYQLRPPLPFTPGSEVAGWVDAVGEGVDTLKPGDRVAALVTSGALAEYAIAREALAVRIPDALSFAQAAASVTNYSTVAYGLGQLGKAAAGETMLVLGAGGGLGMAALDFGRMLGLRSVALASTEAKRAAALEQGAAIVLDNGAEDWRQNVEAQIGKGAVDIVFDPVGGPASDPAFRTLAPGGRHLVLGFAAGEIPRLPLNLPLLRRSSLVGVDWGGAIRADHKLFRPTFAPIAEALSTGALLPARVTAVTSAGASVSLARLRNRDVEGKLVVEIEREAGR